MLKCAESVSMVSTDLLAQCTLNFHREFVLRHAESVSMVYADLLV